VHAALRCWKYKAGANRHITQKRVQALLASSNILGWTSRFKIAPDQVAAEPVGQCFMPKEPAVPDSGWLRLAQAGSGRLRLRQAQAAVCVECCTGAAEKRLCHSSKMCPVVMCSSLSYIFIPAQELFHSLNSKLRAGQPGFHRGSYMVHENRFFHIPASTEVYPKYCSDYVQIMFRLLFGLLFSQLPTLQHRNDVHLSDLRHQHRHIYGDKNQLSLSTNPAFHNRMCFYAQLAKLGGSRFHLR
jgi:hypothetical protein